MLPRRDGDADALTTSRLALGIGAAAFVAVLLFAGAAFAEVCDKVDPEWNPVSGRTTVMAELGRTVASPLFLVPLGLSGLAVAIARPFPADAVAAVCICGTAALYLLDDRQNEIFQMAIAEGCVSGQPVLEAAWAAAGLLAIAAGWTARQRRGRERER